MVMELSIIIAVIFKSDKVDIPKKWRSETLKLLYIRYMGTEKTKLWATESMFWLGVNREIEDLVKLHNICIKKRTNDSK